jgi:hypothetical protein
LFDNEIPFSALMVAVEDKVSLGMVLQILLRQINIGHFRMVVAMSIVVAIFFPTITSLIMVIRTLSSPATSTRLSDYFSLAY